MFGRQTWGNVLFASHHRGQSSLLAARTVIPIIEPLRSFQSDAGILLARVASPENKRKKEEAKERKHLRDTLNAIPKPSVEKPKRPLNAYLLFSADQREEIEALPKVANAEQKVKFGLIGKELGERWRNADDKVKAKYEELASTALEKYQKALKKYHANFSPEDVVILQKERRFRKYLSPGKFLAKTPKDPNAPKRPLSGYFLFSQDLRNGKKIHGIDASEIEEYRAAKVPDSAKISARMWKNLDEKLKESYNTQFAEALEKYKVAKEAYEKESGIGEARAAVQNQVKSVLSAKAKEARAKARFKEFEALLEPKTKKKPAAKKKKTTKA
ncbi:high mobility group box 3 [Phlyctochytrium planicorne]|nr:high mobility group box 3 [Phlyctochytrium planicorne]